jgi:hypothetical protein
MASTEATSISSNSNASDQAVPESNVAACDLIAQVEAIPISSDHNAVDQSVPESNVAACISMAQNAIKSRAGYVAGATHTPTPSQLGDKKFTAAQLLIENIRNNTKKLERELHKIMAPTLALDLKLDEVSRDLDRCFSRIRDQQDKCPSSYLPGACEEVALPEPTVVVVDSRDALVEMLVSMAEALKTRDAAADPSVYLEGLRLREGTDISLVQIFVHASNIVYLVHVAVLGAASFSTSATIAAEASDSTELTLKMVLEASDVKKLFWDCRSDANALFYRYDVKLAGVVDVQLCDIATRETRKERDKIKALCHAFPQRLARKIPAKAIEAWTLIKEAGYRTHHGGISYEETERLYIEAGGVIPQFNTRNDSIAGLGEGENKNYCKTDSKPKSYGEGLFAQNPIRPLMQAYAINDVRVLPVMLQHYTAHRFWNDKWETRVHDSSADRLVEGMGEGYHLTVEVPDKQKCPAGWKEVVQVDRSATS